MTKWFRSAVFTAATALAGTAVAGEFVWIEGESGKPNIKVNNAGWGNAQFMSGAKWMHVAVDADKVEKEIPADGAVIQYPFQIRKQASYEIWNRIGFEFARSAFEYRIDNGDWKQIKPDDLTTDLMEIAFFCEIGWIEMGNAQLASGDHMLEIRLPKTKDKDGKYRRVLYASDAFCISEDTFHPNSRYKPGENYQDEKDIAAARNVFKLPAAPAGQRASVSLKGDWEIARDDEQAPGEVAAPIGELPKTAVFKAIPVPSDKNLTRPDLVFAHRLWYRTKIDVPADMQGRSFYIDFPLNNLNTTVYVNGQLCGFEKNPFVNFQIDVTKAIKPGQVNELWVGIKDAWYGRSANPEDPMKLRRTFNLPMKFFGDGFQQLDYPIWNCPQSGILCTPTFVAAGGKVYTSDVFVKPSVENKQLEADITLTNNDAQNVSGEIRWEAVNDKTNQVEKVFAAKPFAVDAGKSQTVAVSDGWENAKLWWPDDPNMYRLRTSVAVAGKVTDVRETPFGFRRWKIVGTQFTLNGVVWHLWADLIGETGSTPQSWLAAYKQANERLTRFSTAGQAGHDPHWMGMEPQAALDFYDHNGVVVRRNCTLDGETIGSAFSEGDPAIRKQQGGSELKLKLMKNWADQCTAQVKGERNHPSIQIWSIENEFAFINLINLLGKNSPNMDAYEKEIRKAHDAVMAVDPTRSVMTDGGGAMKDNTLGVHGDHYVATLDNRYPDQAYEVFAEGGGRGRWKWDQQRPRYLGEDYYASGINPADYAVWGGEIAFQGKAATKEAVATCYRMLQEGYRWGGYYAAWHFWLGGEGGDRQRIANAPRAALVRQWDWTFGSGQYVTRTYGIFNDTQYADAITFTRVLTINGKDIYTKTSQHNVKPGTAEKFDEEIAMPQVDARQEGQLALTLSVNGKEIFRDTKAVSVLPAPAISDAIIRELRGPTVRPPLSFGDADAPIIVYDPNGNLSAFLKRLKVPCVGVNSLDNLPNARLLIVAPDALSASDCTSTALASYAAPGRTVVVLDQANVLKYQALPAEMETAERTRRTDFGMDVPAAEGKTAFIEDSSHPIFKGLQDKDFFTWPGDHLVYRNAYVKPTRGGKSLLQVGSRLVNTALVEVPVGKGVIYLNQLVTGQKLMQSAVAQKVLVNMIEYAVSYQQEFANVSAVIANEQLGKAMDAVGLQYTNASDPLAAMTDADKKIAVISATPANLKTLADNMPKVQAFWQRGGELVLCGLTPEGLADYNKIVGVNHVIRPFGRERITFPAAKSPLTAGISTGDIVMLSGKRIFDWRADEYVVSDALKYVIDYDEIAPFGKSSFHAYANITNGFVGSDGWPLIIDFPVPKDGKPFDINIDLPREETITELTYKQSMNYNPTTKIALIFDGKDRIEFALKPNGEPQTFAVEPARKGSKLTLQLVEWSLDPAKAANVGIDNIWIKVQRSPEFLQTVKPMLNVGGLMQYTKGNGGVVLCNLNLQENEAVPANKTKKRTIIAAVLRNLKAPFAGGKTVIAGANLDYTPIDIHTKATTYKDERNGFFGDRNRTFAGLPQGRQNFAGVQYDIYEMPTSPTPQVIMLGGGGVPGNLPKEIRDIPVNAKADALFFLHTAKMGNRMNNDERRDKKRFVMFKYVVKYADGQSIEVPVVSEYDIDSYVQKEPKALPGAQVAWTRPYEGSDDKAVAYAMQWNNPKPDQLIQSIDMVSVDGGRGVPVLLAITAAQAK